jgi:hypothetical protein
MIEAAQVEEWKKRSVYNFWQCFEAENAPVFSFHSPSCLRVLFFRQPSSLLWSGTRFPPFKIIAARTP